jgi:transposase
MNFKQSYGQNQRIERITTSHLVIGIDVAKEKHVAQATNFRGIVLSRQHFSFSSKLEGFEKLERWIKGLQKKHRLNNTIIGLEPTGHYWFNLANWLIDRGIHIVLVNPATTKRNKENRDNSPSKNDPKDALIIADLVSRGYHTDYKPLEEDFYRLRTIMNDREFWMTHRIRLQNRIIRWLDVRFPEYATVFKDWTCPRSLATLKEFPSPTDLQCLSIDQVIQGWKKHMKRPGGPSGIQRASHLISEAQKSVGETSALQEAKNDVTRLIAEFDRVVEILKQIDQDILALLPEIPLAKQIQSIKGLGPTFTAAILAGAGDLKQYAHGQQLLRRAGLNLAESLSGKHKGKIVLSKRGDSSLRKYLYLATVQLVSQNVAFKQWHRHNVETKNLKKMCSIMKLMGKLARILIGIVQRGEMFCPDKAAPLYIQAA